MSFIKAHYQSNDNHINFLHTVYLLTQESFLFINTFFLSEIYSQAWWATVFVNWTLTSYTLSASPEVVMFSLVCVCVIQAGVASWVKTRWRALDVLGMKSRCCITCPSLLSQFIWISITYFLLSSLLLEQLNHDPNLMSSGISCSLSILPFPHVSKPHYPVLYSL